jgi:hypothetical protein
MERQKFPESEPTGITNFENIKSMDLETLGKFLCSWFDIECETCPVYEHCSKGSCGFSRWLEMEAARCDL